MVYEVILGVDFFATNSSIRETLKEEKDPSHFAMDMRGSVTVRDANPTAGPSLRNTVVSGNFATAALTVQQAQIGLGWISISHSIP